MPRKLYQHQKETLKALIEEPRTADWSDPGTGKTAVALSLVKRRNATTLVVCPKTLMETAWVADAHLFYPELVVLCSYAPHKEVLFQQHANIFVINVDGAVWLAKQPAKFFRKFDMLIMDESSMLKHHTSQRSRAMNKVKKYFPYRHAMSGTPTANGITDIWHQVYLLDDGERLGKSFYHFQQSTCKPVQTGPLPQHRKWVEKPGSIEAVAGRLSDISVRNRFDDVVDIPKNVMRYIRFSLNKQNMASYQAMREDSILEYKEGNVNAVNAAVRRGKLLQIASGAVYDERGKAKVMATDRYELVAELVKAREHSLIFFLWAHQRDQIIKKLGKKLKYAVIDGSVTSNKKRTQIINDFEAGEYQTLLLHPASAGHGITLVRATATIWPSPTDNYEFWEQANRRMVRTGQKHRTETILVTAKETLEENVYDRMQHKKGNMGTLLELLE